MNQDPNTSSSLEIIEPEGRMTFSSSNSNSFDISRDHHLDYSKDQSSLSFHIEEDRKSIIKESTFGNSILSNQPPKRNRKEIFSKYKVNNYQDGETTKQGALNVCDNQIMRAFDEIFSASTPRSLSNGEIQPTKYAEKKIYAEPETKNLRMLKPDTRFSSDQTQLTLEKNPNKATKQNQDYFKSPGLFKSNQFFKTPLDLSADKPKEAYNKSTLSNLSDIQYRLSAINQKEIDISKDSSDFAQILNAQIFNDRSSIKSPPKPLIVPSASESPTKIGQNQFHKVSVQIPTAQIESSSVKSNPVIPIPKEKQQNLQESRFSDAYQRIDMSQSIANSILVRNPRVQIFGNNGNYMGGNESISSSKMFSKSNSFGNIISQEEQTLINALGSAKLIDEPAEELRIPIYFRKAAKSNSFFPNFNHPSIQLNIDHENIKLQELVQNFSEALYFIEKVLQKIRAKQIKRKQIGTNFSHGITLQKFKTLEWESCVNFEHLDKLKPKQNLLARQWNDSKVEKALQNYRKIIDLHRGIRLNLKDERGIAKYFQIRKKYWDIQKNLILITNDMYTHIMCLGFPKHFEQFKKILEQEEVLFNQIEIRHKKAQLQHFRLLRSKNDELSVSQVGELVINKLLNQIKFNSAAF